MKIRVLTTVAALLFLIFVGAEARQGAGTPGGGQAPPPAASDTIELVFEREVFSYPGYERRNPFKPLTGDEGGPRFEQLRLLGIVYSSDSRESIAVVAIMGGAGARNVLQSYRIRTGETLGNSRVLEIREEQVVMSVQEFGVSETRMLEIQRPDWGAREAESAGGAPADTLQVTPPAGGTGGEGDPGDSAGEFGNGGSS